MKPDWKVAVEKQLKDQGVNPASKKAADNLMESERKKAKRGSWSVEQEAAYKVKLSEREKSAYWAKKTLENDKRRTILRGRSRSSRHWKRFIRTS
jgi:hypothetical protein